MVIFFTYVYKLSRLPYIWAEISCYFWKNVDQFLLRGLTFVYVCHYVSWYFDMVVDVLETLPELSAPGWQPTVLYCYLDRTWTACTRRITSCTILYFNLDRTWTACTRRITSWPALSGRSTFRQDNQRKFNYMVFQNTLKTIFHGRSCKKHGTL